jgi:site-specific DNA-methyltransferase (adenine-specific)
LPKGTYRVIYADPPWQYRDTRAGLGDYAETAAEQDYPTMSVEELGQLDVAGLAHADAVLFCWATFPLLPEALRVVAAWRFTYKTAFVWHKPRGSFGHYHKADAELLLLATRGSCTPDTDRRESQVLTAPVAGHSRKPAAARDLVDRLYTDGPRIELFARGPVAAPWIAWGNE